MSKKVEWPGIATAVGIVLILTLIIVGSDSALHLKEWQTLAAGFLTIGAAFIAFWGATASVRQTQLLAEIEADRRKLALYTKIEYAFSDLSETVDGISGKFIFGAIAGDLVFEERDFLVPEPPELEEAWDFLDLFPRPIIAEIRTVRNSLRQLDKIRQKVGDKKILVKEDEKNPYDVDQATGFLESIKQSAALVAAELEPLINRLAPPMDENERMIRYYGEPDFDVD